MWVRGLKYLNRQIKKPCPTEWTRFFSIFFNDKNRGSASVNKYYRVSVFPFECVYFNFLCVLILMILIAV